MSGLRSIDWRFVLPYTADAVFTHLILAGGSDDEYNVVIENGLARSVTRGRSNGSHADAVVVRANAAWSLQDAVECLSADGVLYFEVARLSARGMALTAGRLDRELRRYGCTPTGLYWVFPRFDRPQIYLPLDVPGALPWYVRHVFVASTPLKRGIEVMLRAASHIGVRALAALVPTLAVTARKTANANGREPVLGGRGVPGTPAAQRMSPLVLMGGESDLNRVVVLPFGKASVQPHSVLKVGRRPEPLNTRIEREQHVLQQIGAGGSAMRQSVPSALGTFMWGPLTVGEETCAEGRLVAATVERWGAPRRRKIEHLHAVLDWVSRFHAGGETESSAWTDERIGEWVSSPIARYRSSLGTTDVEDRLFTAVESRAVELVGQRLPMVWLHWGLASRNIYRAGDRLTVVDWEGGSPGPGLFDVLYFVLSWYFAVENCSRPEARAAAMTHLFLHRDTPAPTVAATARAAIANYLRTQAIDRRFVAPMLAMMLAFRALGQSRLRTRASGDNTYVRDLALLAEHSDTLLAVDFD